VLQGPKVDRARGHAERPLTDTQLYDKFVDCCAVGESKIAADTLFGRLQNMASVGARELTAV
jgi:hypothetical protein